MTLFSPRRIRILALVDADAYGIDIVSVYKYGSASMYHENDSLAAERVEWIGVSASEALRYSNLIYYFTSAESL